MTLREIQRFTEWKRKEAGKLEATPPDTRELIEAGSQFDYMLRRFESSGLDFRAEW